VDSYPQFHWGLFISGSFRAKPMVPFIHTEVVRQPSMTVLPV